MNIGFVGLGKMGGSMVERLLAGGHKVVTYDRSEEALARTVDKGAEGVASLNDLVARLPDRKVIWLMVPSGRPVDESMETLMQAMNPGDILIDGGNSYWRDTQKRYQRVRDAGMHWIDCGTSGGVWGLDNGYCLMYGGDREACDYVESLLQTLAPPNGARYVGPSGAGHFVKMVHNAIEYGMMQAYAEGFEIMKNSPFEIDLHEISQLWQQGSVVRSWLLELTERALGEDPKLSQVEGYVEDSGEGRWAVQSAIDFDTRIAKIEARPETDTSEDKARITELESRLQQLEDALSAMHEVVKTATQAPPEANTTESVYESALEKYRAGEYQAAVLDFQAFLQLYGGDPLSLNARYWLAEALLRAGSYDNAIETGEMLLIDHPDSQKAPDTMFLLGKAYLEKGDASGARGAWEDLVATYPHTTPASKAQALLDQLP